MIQESQQIPRRIKIKRSTSRFIIIKLLEIQKQRENCDSYKRKMTHYVKRNKNLITGWLLRNKRVVEWHTQRWNKKKSQPWVLHPIKLVFKDKGEIYLQINRNDRRCCEQICLPKILKERMFDNNLYLWEGKKNMEIVNVWVNIKYYIFLFLIFFEKYKLV